MPASSAATASASISTTRWSALPPSSACSIAGGAFTFINPQTKAGKLAFILNDSEARFLVTEAHSAGIAAAAVAEAPSVEQTFTTHREGSPEQFRDLREAIDAVAPEPADVGTDPSELAALVYTSGTTRRAEGSDAQPCRARVFGREHPRLPAPGGRRPDPQRPADRVHVRPEPAAALRPGRRYSPARTLVHLPGEDARAHARRGSDRLPSRPDGLRHDSRHVRKHHLPRHALPHQRRRRAAPGPARGARTCLPERVALPHVRPDGVHPRLLPGSRN